MTVGRKRDDRRKKKKKNESFLEAEIMAVVEKSLKIAVDKALDDIFKDWK